MFMAFNRNDFQSAFQTIISQEDSIKSEWWNLWAPNDWFILGLDAIARNGLVQRTVLL